MNALIFSAVWGVVMMFSGIFIKRKQAALPLAVAGMILLLVVNLLEFKGILLFDVNSRGMLSFDRFSLLFVSIIFACTLLYFLLSGRDIEKVGVNVPEYFALIFFIMAGICLVASFRSLLMLFLGIEIISIPLYILAGSDKRNLKSNEASLKYFLMGAFSTGIMLMGIAFLYGATGSFFFELGDMMKEGPGLYASVGLVLLIVAMSFKVSAAPFHFWTPDVYDGSPAVFTSFMATIVKAAAFIAFVRLFDDTAGFMGRKWLLLISVITAATLIIGNITAVFQQSVKRMLAYSSIAQAGFMMLAVFSLNAAAKEGLLLYSIAYTLATVGIFAVLIRMKDYTFDGFNGLAKQQPLLAAVTTVFLLSLAGIPLTAGFFAKYYMLMSAAGTEGYLWLIILAVLCAAVSVYYYFRVIQAMYFKQGNAEATGITPLYKLLLTLIAAVLVILGIFPHIVNGWLYFG
jgi:NADH-quinone oxidoreductase subunit N